MPSELIDALIEQGARELTIVNNNAGNGDIGLAALLKAKRVRKIICSFPRQTDSYVFDALYRAGEIELELVPQGNLAERIRAAGAGIGGFFTPTAYGTKLAEGKETRLIDGRHYVLEAPLHADFALIKAYKGDRWGNLIYRKTARNFGPIMPDRSFGTVPTPALVAPIEFTMTYDTYRDLGGHVEAVRSLQSVLASGPTHTEGAPLARRTLARDPDNPWPPAMPG